MQIDPQTQTLYTNALQLNAYRATAVAAAGGNGNILFRCWGGLGDKVCSEPTIRWAFYNWKWKRFAIATSTPELFEHIPCEKIQVKNDGQRGDWNPQLWYELLTIHDQCGQNLSVYFHKHLLTHPVDYVSLNCTGAQLPVADREINLPDFRSTDFGPLDRCIVVHPGKHWASKTFPAAWWEEVCDEIRNRGLTPLIIGQAVDENVGVVDFAAPTSEDFRNKLSLRQLVALLKSARCLVSNDSAPIHIAAAGHASIGVIATCKHPDFLGHWRNGQWQWRFQNLSRNGLYNTWDTSPFQNNEEPVTSMDITPEFLAECLPPPADVADFAARSVDAYSRLEP